MFCVGISLLISYFALPGLEMFMKLFTLCSICVSKSHTRSSIVGRAALMGTVMRKLLYNYSYKTCYNIICISENMKEQRVKVRGEVCCEWEDDQFGYKPKQVKRYKCNRGERQPATVKA